ncbi:MAG: manganese efflux pump MntP family protein [Clostridiales bacterium]|nr:manganese efflux pump MntP family protein [Clostridiales bacterium]
MFEIILIAIGLAMDAFAVSVCKGLKMTEKIDYKYAFIIAFFFGFFQAIMPLIGWIAGKQFEAYITSIDHWIAFVLLVFIGGKMIYEALGNEDDSSSEIKYDLKEITMLAVATSIDALAVGISFAFLDINIVPSVICIGIITFVLSVVGVIIGNKFGVRFKRNAEVSGGIILILIGVKILLNGLGIINF